LPSFGDQVGIDEARALCLLRQKRAREGCFARAVWACDHDDLLAHARAAPKATARARNMLVIPAKAGIQTEPSPARKTLDSRLRGNNGPCDVGMTASR